MRDTKRVVPNWMTPGYERVEQHNEEVEDAQAHVEARLHGLPPSKSLADVQVLTFKRLCRRFEPTQSPAIRSPQRFSSVSIQKIDCRT